MIFEGSAHTFGRDVDTDVIIPARYLNTTDPKVLAEHLMEDVRPGFSALVKAGDIIIFTPPSKLVAYRGGEVMRTFEFSKVAVNGLVLAKMLKPIEDSAPKPVVEEPVVVVEPVVEVPVEEPETEPVVEEALAEEAVIEAPVAEPEPEEAPAAEEAVIEEPAVEEAPAAEEPIVEKVRNKGGRRKAVK